jgi:hypothetical protein
MPARRSLRRAQPPAARVQGHEAWPVVALAHKHFNRQGGKGGRVSCSDPAQDSVREQLREQLLALPVPAFEHLMARLLGLCGYAEVQVLAGSQGGADLSAATSGGLSRSVTLVQAKQYRSPVSRRFVDELRGAMLRTGAQQGVLLTTSTSSDQLTAPCGRAARSGAPGGRRGDDRLALRPRPGRPPVRPGARQDRL